MNKPWGKKDFPDTEPLSMTPQGDEHLYADTAPQPLMELEPAAPKPLDLGSLELAPLEITLYDA
ncbi:MAG TPA: hypothetical protein VNB23_10370, partial [Ramlibacter sp.]|nr:hypothetical protein [Ramlibacter sp.]